MTMKPIANIGSGQVTPEFSIGSTKKDEADIGISDNFKKTGNQSLNLIDPGKIKGSNVTKAAMGTVFADIKTGVNKLWEKDLEKIDGPVSLQPVLYDKHIHINSGGFTRKLDMDGNEIWKKETGASGYHTPVFDKEGNLYVVGQNELISLDKDGNGRWKNKIGKRGCSHDPLMGHDGKIYLIGDDNEVSCYNTNGKTEWTRVVKGALSHKPFLDKNGILHVEASVKGGFSSSSLKLDTGRKGESLGVEQCKTLHHLTVDKNGNTYGFRGGKFRVTDPGGKELWAVDLPGDTLSSYQKIGPDGNLYVRVRNHAIICFEPDGKEKWRLENDQKNEPLSGSYAWADDGTFYVTGDGGNWKLYAINPDGTKKWVQQEDKHIKDVKVGPDGTIFTGGEMYPLKAYSPDSGKRQWKFDASLAFGDNYSITDSNDIIVATEDCKLIKLHYTTREEAIQKQVKKSITKAETKENLKIEKGDKWIDIGGVRLKVNK
ncbi:MAG: PQQ-binding-like beta-propeller repeat protein [Candidatus Eremiobacteraeota bacterium]|nr:PQQ-binding-like beta-propeller repeat protein [Candidatus Eremiobacteraeota bacterium]